jgi:FkbM family methyltransferase
MKTVMRKIRVALTPKGWYLKTTLSNGVLVYGANREGFGGRGIYIFRESIEPEFQHLESFLDPSGVLVDIGANTGIYTLKAAKHFSKNGGVVLAIEPFPDVLATLFHSIEDNGFTNVRLRNFCAGDHTGLATLWRNFNKPNSFSLIKRDEKASNSSTLTVALDDLFMWEGLERLDYLKIDAEGAEQRILAGARKTIKKYRPIIQLEITINNIQVNLLDYSVFQAPQSPNKVCVPNENPRIRLPKQLGWVQITS